MFPVDTTVSITPASTRPGLDDPRRAVLGGRLMRRVWALLLVCGGLLAGWALPAHAAEPEIRQAALHRTAEGLFFSARLTLNPSPAVEDALLKGVPLYFVWEAEVLRDRNALYRQVSAEQVENDYTLKLVNKSQEARRYRITLETADAGLRLSGPNVVEAGPEQVLPVALSVAGGSDVHGRRLIRFVVEREDGAEKRVIESSFFGPVQ